jgi:cytochrome b6-f complex iron-sulfur subunit
MTTIVRPEELLTEERRHTRRQFCSYTCQAVSLFAAGTLAGCGHSSPTSPGSTSATQLPTVAGSVAGRTITVTVDAGSPIANVGSAALMQTSIGRVLLARTNASAFTAVTADCTHESCTITGFDNAEYVCPCHGSRFTTSGTVINGPAQRPLQQFATTFDGTVLTVTV